MRGCSGIFSHFLKHVHALKESAWNVEASLPFSAHEREEDFAASVEITVPLSVFGIGEFLPGVFVDAVIPLPAFLPPGGGEGHGEGDEGLGVDPPEFLIPRQL